ncbi:MAG: iron-containing alcohol dehydrogenase, partial [Lactobacillus sp.]|nr:iron-containing alcohol dehydrogenase [Lactobacillus sp.]
KACMETNKPAIEDRLAALCTNIWPEEGSKSTSAKADFVIAKIAEIVAKTEIPTDLKKFGVQETDLDFLVDSALEQKRLLSHNLKKLTRSEIAQIYKAVM